MSRPDRFLELHAREQRARYEQPDYQAYLEGLREWMEGVAQDILAELYGSAAASPTVSSRLKAPESFEQKAARPAPDDASQPKYQDACDRIHDQIGMRVVPQLGGEVQRLVDAIRADPRLRVGEVVDKDRQARSRRGFGYSAHHVVVRAESGADAPLPPAGFMPAHVEIQVRTALKDIWAAVEHGARYKGELPDEVSRIFDRAAALVDLADLQLQEAVEGAQAAQTLAAEARKTPTPDVLTPSALQTVLDRHFPGARRSGAEGAQDWMLGLLENVGCGDVEELERRLGTVQHAAVNDVFIQQGHVERDQVRHLDDAMLAAYGEAWVEGAATPPPNSSDRYRRGRPGILRWRLERLREAGAVVGDPSA
jgi:ppGpp synthetase/RelA/SpoT-type nucleotidyltranferase